MGSPLNLSNAAKLKDLTFRRSSNVPRIIAALQTVESTDLHQITIHPYTGVHGSLTNETVHREWQDLDRLLVQFCASHPIRPRLVYSQHDWGKDTRDHAPSLLPGLTRRGLVDLVKYSPPSREATLVW